MRFECSHPKWDLYMNCCAPLYNNIFDWFTCARKRKRDFQRLMILFYVKKERNTRAIFKWKVNIYITEARVSASEIRFVDGPGATTVLYPLYLRWMKIPFVREAENEIIIFRFKLMLFFDYYEFFLLFFNCVCMWENRFYIYLPLISRIVNFLFPKKREIREK